MTTTISLDEEVRDRLKGYCGPGLTYSEALTRILDLIDADRYFASFRDAISDAKFPWIPEERMKWD